MTRRRTEGSRSPAGVLLSLSALWTGSLSGLPAASDPFGPCEARVAARPESWASYCYVDAAREHRLWDEARRRVEARRERRPADPFLRFTLGFLELEGGDLGRAAEHFATAAETFAARADAPGETLAWMNLGECRMRQGLLEETEQVLRRAETAARTAGDQGLLVRVAVRQTRLAGRQGGDLEQADLRLRRIEDDLSPETPYSTWRTVLYERASIFHRLGRYDEARAVNRRWAELARRADQPYDEATVWSSLARNAVADPRRAGAREEAIRLARTALDAAEAAGNRTAAIAAHHLLGKLLPDAEGRTHLETCLRLAAAAGDTRQQAACLFALAGSLADHDAGRSREVLDRALALAGSSEDVWTAAYGWADRFRVAWATMPRDAAAADSLAVLDHLETLRRHQGSETARAELFTDWAEVYHALIGALLRAPDAPSRTEVETAFTVAERFRARVLLESLAASRAEPPAPTDGPLAEDRTAVLGEIVRIQRTLQDPALGETERGARLTELDGLERGLAELDRRSGVASPLPEVGFVELPRVETELAPSQAVLAFSIAPDQDVFGELAGGSWLLAVTGSGTRVYRLPGAAELEAKVLAFVGLAQRRDDQALELGAAALYEDLLGAALAGLPARVEELILVPDGILHRLPFALLRPDPRGDPLAARYRLSEAPSVTLWHRWRRSTGPPPSAALVLADPAFVGAGGPDPQIGNSIAALEAQNRRWALEIGDRLGRLPHAEREGRSLVRHLGGASRLLVGEDASEAFLKGARLDELGVIHFAAHALVDEERPRRSAVLLAPGAAEEDGLLQPREIAALDLEGKLVVVSACESGSGQVLLGEGVQSLARAFFRAGARAVVASRWRLRDDEAAELFDRFYRRLARGESVAGAVSRAQSELRRMGAPAAAWAGVVALGDGGMVPVPGGRGLRGWRWLPLVPVTALVVWGLYRTWRRGDPSILRQQARK